LSTVAEELVGLLKELIMVLLLLDSNPINEDVGAHLPYFLGSTLGEQAEVRTGDWVTVD
jgi:hypothetical protein